MKICLVTERDRDFTIGEGGLYDTNDVNIAACLGADQHFSLVTLSDYSVFEPYDFVIVKMSKVKMPYEQWWMGFCHSFKDRFPGKVLAMYQEAESFWPIFRGPQEQVDLFNAIRRCDLFMAHNDGDADFYKLLKMDSRVVTAPTALPIQLIESARISMERRERHRQIVFGSSFDDRAYGLLGYAVAVSVVKDIQGWTLLQYSRSNYGDGRNDLMANCFGVPFESLSYMPWINFMDRISESYVVMNLMPAAAAGRDAIMCAALGLPHIGNYRLNPMRSCFPQTAIDIYDVAKARQLLVQLIADKEFYKQVSDTAIAGAKEYSLPAVGARLRIDIKNAIGLEIP